MKPWALCCNCCRCPSCLAVWIPSKTLPRATGSCRLGRGGTTFTATLPPCPEQVAGTRGKQPISSPLHSCAGLSPSSPLRSLQAGAPCLAGAGANRRTSSRAPSATMWSAPQPRQAHSLPRAPGAFSSCSASSGWPARRCRQCRTATACTHGTASTSTRVLGNALSWALWAAERSRQCLLCTKQ